MQETALFDRLENLIAQARALGADAADAVYFETTDIAVSERMGKPEDLERAESSAVGLRVFVGQQSANLSSTDMSATSLRTLCEQAVVMAKASLPDPHAGLAPADLWVKDQPELDLCEADEPPLEWMREQCVKAEALGLEHAAITNSEGASAHVSRSRITLATSTGFARSYAAGSNSISLTLIAGEGDKMERDYDYSVARYRGDLRSPESVAEGAIARTLRRMNPRKVPTQSVPVIFDPRVARSFAGYVASAISGAAVARGTTFLKDKLGEAMMASDITLTDDPHRLRGLGSKPFDGEGVANRKRHLIERGVLQSWLLDMRSASQLGLQSTGHASRGLGSAPHPSSTNVYFEAGKHRVADLMSGIAQGFYVTDTFGMGVNLVTGDYSQGASGVWIENGELTYAVSELTIAGNLADMFMQMQLADDLQFDYATNSPTMRIDGMMVAGV